MHRKRGGPGHSATSLMEIMIATVILTVAAIPILTFFTTTTESLKQTIPYHQAIFLAEKGVEEVRLGAYEDPYAVELILSRDTGATDLKVTQGLNPYFLNLEDSMAPAGRILPGVDWAIQPEVGPLFKQVDLFRLGVSTVLEDTPGIGSEARSVFLFQWKDLRLKGMRYQIATPLHTWVRLDRVEPPLAPDTELKLGDALEPGAGKTLTQIVAQRGAERAKLEAYARVLYFGGLGQGQIDGNAPLLAAKRATRASTGDPVERARLTGLIGRMEEALATTLLAIVQELRAPLEELRSGIPPGSLGTPPPSETQRDKAVEWVRVCLQGFLDHTQASLAEYSTVSQTATLPPGWRLMAYERILRVSKMAVITYPWASRDPLKDFLTGLCAYYDGRMPNILHFMEEENNRVDSLETTYSLAPAADDFKRARDCYLGAGTNLVLYGL